MSKLKIKRGDNVIITTGKKDIKGKTGEVIEVIKKEGKDPKSQLTCQNTTINKNLATCTR